MQAEPPVRAARSVGQKARPMKRKSSGSRWEHPGGKLREHGSASLTDQELLAIIISTGVKGRSAQDIAGEILERFGSAAGLANQPLEKLLGIRGLSDVKIIRIAAAFELAARLFRSMRPRDDGEDIQAR